MSNKLSLLFNSTSALLEFQIWSDTTSHAIPFKSCTATGKNRFVLVTASLNDVLPMRNGSTPRPPLKPPYFPAWWFILEKHVVEDDVLFTSKFEPVTYFPLLTKHRPRCFKINDYTTHTYYTIILCREKLSLTFLPFQSESTIPDQMQFILFCFESPKLSLNFFNCSCSPIDVKMEQKGQS